MRNYKQKMDKYRLPPGRMNYLRNYCQHAGDGQKQTIKKVLLSVTDPVIADFLFMNVCKGKRWRHLEAHGIPCCGDTFRFYRMMFYYHLDRELQKESEESVLVKQ